MTYSQQLAEKAMEAAVPEASTWTVDQVADWVRELGYPQYQECFVTNYIDGRKLIFINQSSLPLIGIKDFLHMKMISRALRELLKIEEPNYRRSMALPERDKMAAFLLQKSQTGKRAEALTLIKFLKSNKRLYDHTCL